MYLSQLIHRCVHIKNFIERCLFYMKKIDWQMSVYMKNLIDRCLFTEETDWQMSVYRRKWLTDVWLQLKMIDRCLFTGETDWQMPVYRRNRCARHALDIDIRDKHQANVIEIKNSQTGNDSFAIGYHPGVEDFDNTWVTLYTELSKLLEIFDNKYCLHHPI